MDEHAPDQTYGDTNPQAPAPAPAPTQVVDASTSAPAYGSILGIILIVAVLVAGAFYMWNQRAGMNNDAVMPENGVRGDTIPFDDSANGSVEGSLDLDAEGPQPL